MNKQTWLVVVFVLLAVVVGLDQWVTSTKDSKTLENLEAVVVTQPVTLKATDSVNANPAVNDQTTQVQKTVPTEAELKDVKFCVAKDTKECKVCLTSKCTSPTGDEVTCYTQSSNCVEGKSQRRLSRSEVAHFDQIVEHNFTW